MEDPDWKYDLAPEIMNGKNVDDFIDADLERRLQELEEEEEMLLLGRPINDEDIEEETDLNVLEAQKQISSKKAALKIQHRMKVNKKAYPKNKELQDFESILGTHGKQVEGVHERFKKRSKPKPLTSMYAKDQKKIDIESGGDNGDGVFMDDEDHPVTHRKIEKKLRSFSRSRSKGAKREMSAHEKVN